MERAHENTIAARRTVTVNKHREEVYRFWRNLENLPKIMDHLESVKILSPDRSHCECFCQSGKASTCSAREKR